MNTIDVMKQALEALEEHHPKYNALCNDLHDAIAEMEEVEPVAWYYMNKGRMYMGEAPLEKLCKGFDWKPLYTHPAPALPVAWMSPDGKVSTTKGVVFRIPLYPAPAVPEGEK